MTLINKNIWMAFYLVSILWGLSLSISSYSTYQRVYDEFVTQQISLTNISKNSLNATFDQYEVLLSIVASQVLKNDKMIEEESIISIMQTATNLHSSVRAFGLFNLDGSTRSTYPVNPETDGRPLLTVSESKASFEKTITANKMVIGRTYFSESLNDIIIPFRLAVRDSMGDTKMILSIAVSVDKGFSFFVNNVIESGFNNTYLYREMDRYFQLAPIDRIHDANVYQQKIPKSKVKITIEELSKTVKTPLAELKESEITFTNETFRGSNTYINASVYIKEYSMWLITEIKLTEIMQAFLYKVKLLVLVHLLSIVLIFFLFRNIASSEKKKVKELKFQANHDYLTQLFNRYYFDQYCEKVNSSSPFTLIYLDIDHFNTINDSYGHAVGDQLLKAIALRVKGIAHPQDLVIRSSSDEFILVCFHKTELQTNEFCKQLLASVNTTYLINDAEILLTASIGVSVYPKDSSNPEDIKRNADLAMNSAKTIRNTTAFFNKTLLNDYLYKCSVERELKNAVKHNELYMLYQPQQLSDGTVVGVEALIRWENKTLGFMSPDQFIPIAESIGAMDTVGEFVIEQTLSDMVSLQQRIGTAFSVSINVSVKQFKKPDFYDILMVLVERYQFPTNLLILEITESVLIDDIDAMQRLMVKIKKQGIRISLDDFGTGYSSLSILHNLSIDELKIDKSFVDHVVDDAETRSMISTMISIAQCKKMKTVVEGVETKEALLTLTELGCDIYQGYYFSKPIDKHQLEFFITNPEGHQVVDQES
ncbi:bifunctional diguanylate cyclase/phosphodiesterase [Psychromonas sp. Urea-02u-13]|uniref:bifunctional diguanylate cyclase/phosphodiesterase n=1 Tax=Psychromonas sp. Urea-02u-13 TaxID=2058326 RepID=UPI000C33BB5B|nr:EAL domain-containing protein [Psychromonas sp. Urea-02u-13]PKG37870.1 bifunctional diguanylate cyclase/phosphodiesterase [Psychromonas sp. Urea-02u-13]